VGDTRERIESPYNKFHVKKPETLLRNSGEDGFVQQAQSKTGWW